MSTYRKVFNQVKLTTYEDVRKTIDNVEKVLTIFDITRKNYHFHFSCGDNQCVAESITEFVENAYGREDFRLISMQMMYFLSDEQHFSINYLCSLQISATSNTILEKIVNQLSLVSQLTENCTTNLQPTPISSQNTVTSNSSPINTTVVNGDGNYIVTGNGSINYKGKKSKEPENPKRKNSLLTHPLLVGIISAVIAGVILSFGFWEDLIAWIENLFN